MYNLSYLYPAFVNNDKKPLADCKPSDKPQQ